MKILIVDDDAVFVSQISDALKNNGFEPFHATSTSQAISLLNNTLDIRLIILDIVLPDTDGFYLLKYLKDNTQLSHIPVLACSSIADETNVLKTIRMGAKDYIIKPTSPESLISKIRKLLTARPQKTILIVDDDEFILDILAKIVEREGFKALKAADGNEALKILESHKISAVISDIAMPGMSGLDLLTAIKSRYSNIPVLLITGHAGKYQKEDVTNLGADGFIIKPFKNIEIITKLKSFDLQPA